MAMRPALAAFRRLMRARELAFQGDTEMLTQSRLAVRAEFLKHKVPTSLAHLHLARAPRAPQLLVHILSSPEFPSAPAGSVQPMGRVRVSSQRGRVFRRTAALSSLPRCRTCPSRPT